MKKALAIILTLMLLAVCLTGCSGQDSANSSAQVGSGNSGNTESAMPDYYGSGTTNEADQETADSSGLSGVPVTPSGSGNLAEKIIYTAEINMETMEFDNASEQIAGLVNECGGFFERSSVDGNSYRSQDDCRFASFTIRVPKENYETVLGGLQELGNVLYVNSYTENITSRYVDTESRLAACRTEEERLLYMLEKAETVEDMLAIEERLSDVRYEIESLTSSIMNMDNMVNYCTIDLYLNEVARLTPASSQSYWQELGTGFKETLRDIGGFFKGLFRWFIVALPVLVILAAAAAVIIFIIKLAIKKRRAKNTSENVTTGFSDGHTHGGGDREI